MMTVSRNPTRLLQPHAVAIGTAPDLARGTADPARRISAGRVRGILGANSRTVFRAQAANTPMEARTLAAADGLPLPFNAAG